MNPGEKTIFQEYLTNQGTVVKPYCWQRQNHTCAKCPYHIRTGEEATVPYAELDRVFGFSYRSTATLRNKHLLFCELRSSSGSIVQKGHATDCTEQGYHPESVLFGVGAYLDAVTDAHANIGCIVLYSNYSPCNEVYHCCIKITLCIYFSQFYLTENGFHRAAWNGKALQSLSQPVATLQRVPGGARCYLPCNFVYGIPGAAGSGGRRRCLLREHPCPALPPRGDPVLNRPEGGQGLRGGREEGSQGWQEEGGAASSSSSSSGQRRRCLTVRGGGREGWRKGKRLLPAPTAAFPAGWRQEELFPPAAVRLVPRRLSEVGEIRSRGLQFAEAMENNFFYSETHSTKALRSILQYWNCTASL
uniref:Apolipoprotein B mRNA editing enzyme catalytic polypeptide like 4 n=1 Tax=Athene cunicularia TaxID=194338 RepID=A0A663M5L0_ATHCN